MNEPNIINPSAGTQAAHTPGPWTHFVGRTLIRIEADAESASAGRHICTLPKIDSGNVLLITAAPDLLKAAEKAVIAMRNSNCSTTAKDELRAVIAKAKGGAL